jgi:hypothetical protein
VKAEHYTRMAQLLEHATHTIALDPYGDWIEDDKMTPPVARAAYGVIGRQSSWAAGELDDVLDGGKSSSASMAVGRGDLGARANCRLGPASRRRPFVIARQ